MHELSLAESVRDILEDYAAQNEIKRIDAITMEIGQLSCVEQHALHTALTVALENTLAAHARLDFKLIPGRGYCSRCQQETDMQTLADPCPLCGQFSLEYRQGKDTRVASFEGR